MKLAFRRNSCLLVSDYCCPVLPHIKLCIFVCLFCVLFWFLFWDPDIVLELLGTLGESSRGGFFSLNQQPFQLCAFAFCFSQCEHHLGFLRFLYLLSVESDLFLPVHGICFSCRLFGIN